jgi:uncharacterized membrane protein YoaK (UPF0700 family)
MMWLAYVLAAIAGIVDVAGYIALGGIFTAHVSGDTVMAAVALAHGSWVPALQQVAPVPLIVVGYLIGGTIVKLATTKKLPYWFSIGAAGEALFLAIFALAHHRFAGNSLSYVPQRWTLIGLMACLSFAMGVQNSLLRSVESAGVRTTFVTGMIVSFAHELLDWIFARFTRPNPNERGDKAGLYAGIWASFAVGGCVGGYLQVIHGATIFLIPSLAMTALALYAWRYPFARVEPGT